MGTRRCNGEGTLYRVREGRWRAQASLGGKRVSVSGRTQREAARELGRILGEATVVTSPSVPTTLAALLERWLAEVIEPTLRPRTHRLYADMARLHLVPAFGGLALPDLGPDHVRRLHAALLERGLAPKTVRIVHGVLRGALGQAVTWQLVPGNVAALTRPPRVPHKEMAILDRGQVRRLLAVAAGGRWSALIVMALATGMRQGELLGLQWADVDLEACVVRVRRQLGRDGGVAEPKTANGRRAIDLPPSTATMLLAHRREQERRPAGDGHAEFVFRTSTGRPLYWRNVSRAFTSLLVQAGLPRVPFHALRHTAVALLIYQGVHPKVVQERLGHGSAATTLDYYGHLLPGLGRAAAERLDLLLA